MRAEETNQDLLQLSVSKKVDDVVSKSINDLKPKLVEDIEGQIKQAIDLVSS